MVRLIFSVLKKRDVLYGEKTPVEELVEYGWAYLDAGDAAVALDFFEQAGRRELMGDGALDASRKGLEEMKRLAIEEGDAFSLTRISRLSPKFVSEGDWTSLIESARRLGKDSMAECGERVLHPPEEEEENAAAAPGTESVQ